jgi:DNA-binding CsgD family transcriptional regulator
MRICRQHDEARGLRLAVLDELRVAVGFDAYSWLLTDPETEVGCAPLADVPASRNCPVTEALRRCQAATFDEVPVPPERTGPVVLMLSSELEVRAQTPETDRYLRILVPPDDERRPVPSGAYNVAAQLLAVEAGVDDHPPWARVHLSGGAWLTLRAARIGDAPPDIAVTVEVASPAERTGVFARALGLSGREVELLGHLVAGADPRLIAETMFLSEHTVQDHLKSIFAKSGTRNRRTLLARAAGR